MAFFGKNPNFDKLIDKATSHLLLEPDWNLNLSACDLIRQGEITAKYGMQAVKKKLNNNNPHVVMHALCLIEALAKNCGSSFHDEIATSEFMNQMKGLAREKDPIKSKALELIQVWANVFRSQPKYHIVQTTYQNLKSSGVTFPLVTEADTMFISETAPEWQDSDSCYRCKVVFSTLRRKHHCRNCGNIFCDDCTQKRSNIPKYGIEKDVRVCDTCFDTLKGSGRPQKGVQFADDVEVKRPAESKDTEAAKLKELELQEKEELELALALSASEAETKSKQNNSKQNRNPTSQQPSQPTPENQSGLSGMYATLDTSEMDPELARYLNRNYWENKVTSTTPSTGTAVNRSISPSSVQSSTIAGSVYGNISLTQPTAPSLPSMSPPIIANSMIGVEKSNEIMVNGGVKAKQSQEQEEFLAALRSSVDIFVNRMQSNKQRGRSIANDSAVQTLFLTLNAMHPQLLQYLNDQDDKRNYFESLQDKLAQLRDAREALDALREEHREKRRQEEEEANRLRQIQMMQKLQVMRQKKNEYLDYQRQLAVERMHQQERDMAIRMAQQNQIMQMKQYQQQFPYSMNHQQQMTMGQQQQQQQQAPLPVFQPQLQLQQQPPQQPVDMYAGNYRIPTGTGVMSTGPPHTSMPPTGQQNPADYYNMQGMSQNLPNHHQSNIPDSNMSGPTSMPLPNNTQMSYYAPPPPQVAMPTNLNSLPTQPQSTPPQQQHGNVDWNNPNNQQTQPISQQPPPPPPSQTREQNKTEDERSLQLISFD